MVFAVQALPFTEETSILSWRDITSSDAKSIHHLKSGVVFEVLQVPLSRKGKATLFSIAVRVIKINGHGHNFDSIDERKSVWL